ncbi:uncharacterized protein LOC120431021 [Culex pipiens pallens]|nr:uncharacterized protein LOC120431021 [Culex pipiens pallens]
MPEGDNIQPDGNLLYERLLQQNERLEAQNARMMEMLERFNLQDGSSRTSNGPEFIIETLASNIREFVYDPDNGLVFDRWYRKYEDLFLKDGAKLDDAAKVRLLLRSLNVAVHDKYVNFVLPKHPRDIEFKETVKKLTELFSVQASLFSKRYQCFQLSKSESDDFVTYAGIVNKHCEDFELKKLTADQFKSLLFICGLRSSRDADIRTRLLSMLEVNAEGACTLEALITECHRLQNLKHDTAMVEHKPVSSVCAVKQDRDKPSPTTGSSSSDSQSTKTQSVLPPSPCWCCGDMHFVRDCAYKQHVCQDCMQTGHKEGYCSCVPKKSKNKQQTNVNSLYAANRVNSTSKRKFLTVSINGSQASLQFDTGSDITVISRKQWCDNMDSPPLSPTKQIARTASGKSLSLLGELRCQVTLGGVTRTGTFYVTDKQINLFGLDWIELFELWDTPMTAVCSSVTGKVNRVKQQRSLAVKSQGEANMKTGLGPTDAASSPSESTAWHEEHLRWYCS